MGRRRSASASRHAAIAQHLRAAVVRGTWPPGARLPTRVELEQRFQASSRTVQQALTALIHDGIVRADRRHGTFVVDAPPHLARYALVLPVQQAQVAGDGHWRALHAAGVAAGAAHGGQVDTYYLADELANAAELQRLTADVTEHRVAGLLFAWPPHGLRTSPVLTAPGVPRLGVGVREQFPGVVNVAYDTPSYAAQVLAPLRAQARRRLALLMPQYPPAVRAGVQQCLQQEAAAAGIAVPPTWILGAARGLPDLTQNTLALLLDQPADQRPDALLIQDDNLVPDVTAALAALHVRVPADLLVVAHTNFPAPPPAAVPVHRVGYDMAAVWRQALAYIDAQRRGATGTPLPTELRIPACTGAA